MAGPGFSYTSLLFKDAPGGYIFQAPGLSLTGERKHYLVDAQQRAEIEAIMPKGVYLEPFKSMVWATVIFSVLIMVIVLAAMHTEHPFTIIMAGIGALIAIGIWALQISNRKRVQRLQPILERASLTEQAISIDDMSLAMSKSKSPRGFVITGSVSGLFAMAFATVVYLSLYWLDPGKSYFGNPIATSFSLYTIGLIALSAISFKSAILAGIPRGSNPTDGQWKWMAGLQRVSILASAAAGLFGVALLIMTVWQDYTNFADGKRFIAKKDYDKAISSFTKAIEDEPYRADTYMQRALAYVLKSENARAISDFTKVIELEPRNVAPLRQRAGSYRAIGDHGKAISDLTKAIEMAPQESFLYLSRSWSLSSLGAYDQSLDDATKAIELEPNSAGAYKARGDVYFHEKQLDLALADFSKATLLEPKDPYARIQRGRVYQDRNEFDFANGDFTKAIDMNIAPAQGIAYTWKGALNIKLAKYDQAVSDFSKALEFNAAIFVSHNNRAFAYLKTGERDLAASDYKAVLGLTAKNDSDRRNQQIARDGLARIGVLEAIK